MPARKKNDQAALPGTQTTAELHAILWSAADKLRGSMDAAQYKDFVLGLVFLKYVSDAFAERREAIRAELVAEHMPESRIDQFLDDKDEYTGAGVFWVPEGARWDSLALQAKSASIGELIDNAMDAIMKENQPLTGVLPKIFNRDNVDQRRLGELVDLLSDARFTGHEGKTARDVLGEVYEYFLERFARAEGKRGGEFYTPASVVKLLVEVLEPYSGRVYDPCCGSGGMFVQAEKFVLAHGHRHNDIAVYGQESNERTWRLAKMNLAIHGINGDLSSRWEDTFYADKHPDIKADYVLANPPFNMSDWARNTSDTRWRYGVPPAGNANSAWLQHIVHKLSANGSAGVVLANGSMSSKTSGEGEIRAALSRSGPDCMHDRAAAAALPYHPDPCVPVVFRQGQGPPGREAPSRPARRTPVHRRPLDWHPNRPHGARLHAWGYRQDRRHIPRLARDGLCARNRPEVRRRRWLLPLSNSRRSPQSRPCANTWSIRRGGRNERRRRGTDHGED